MQVKRLAVIKKNRFGFPNLPDGNLIYDLSETLVHELFFQSTGSLHLHTEQKSIAFRKKIESIDIIDDGIYLVNDSTSCSGRHNCCTLAPRSAIFGCNYNVYK